MMHLKPYETHEGRRKYPGIVIQQPVEIKYKTKTLQATVYDISPDGLQIRCDRNTMRTIHPSGEFIRKNNTPHIDVVFSHLIGKNQRQIKATCRIYYFVLLPEEKYKDLAFGVQFKKLKGNSAKYVGEFIIDALIPIESVVRAYLDEPRSRKEIGEHIGLAPKDVSRVLLKLMEDGEILTIGSSSRRKHIHLVAVISTLLQEHAELKQRVSQLEKSKRGR